MNHEDIKRRIIEQQQYVKTLLQRQLVTRDMYPSYKKNLSTSLIKVILGPRRAGKTTLGLLLLKDKEWSYVNFDDDILSTLKQDDLGSLLEVINEIYGKRKHLFLDEIQNIDGWEFFINRLQRLDYNILLSGSNSKLLSKELSSHLGGRTLSMEVLPFSFSEFLKARDISDLSETDENIGLIKHYLQEYLTTGGFPDCVIELRDQEVRKKYLNELFDTILFRDITQRFHLKYTAELVALATIILNHFASRTNLTKLSKDLGMSVHTVKKYLSYLEESYLLLGCKKFSFKPREMESAYRKYFCIDTGLLLTKKNTLTQDFGKLLENIVAIELKKRGKELYYYIVDNKFEVDFVIGDVSGITEVIQVVDDQQELPKRELRTGILACKKLRCSLLRIITWDREEKQEKDGIIIQSIPLWKWLLPTDTLKKEK